VLNHDEYRVFVDRRAHRTDVCLEFASDRNRHDFDAQVVSDLIPDRIGRCRNDDLRGSDVLLTPRLVTRSLDSKKDTLGVSGHEAADGPIAVEQVGGHSDDVVLEAL
jgi:hypothetical protein